MDPAERARQVIESIRRDSLELHPHDNSSPSNLQLMLQRALRSLSEELYSKDTRFVLELIQNAADNQYAESTVPTMRIELHQDRIVIRINETGFTEANVRAICDIGTSTKKEIQGFIGEKGIGFKAVFKVAHVVHVNSGAYQFKFNRDGTLGMVAPIWEPDVLPEAGWTTLTLELSPDYCGNPENHNRLAEQLRSLDPSLLLFLRNPRVLELYFPASNTTRRLTRQARFQDPGIIRLSSTTDNRTISSDYLIVRKVIDMSGISVSGRKNISTSEILLGFPLRPDDTPLQSFQNVHAFLPLRSWGFYFLIQADFLTASNREDILADSPWNIRLRDAVCDVFVDNAIPEFLERSFLKTKWHRYLPNIIAESFFSPLVAQLYDKVRQEKIVEGVNGALHLPSDILIPQPRHCNATGTPLVPQEYLSGRFYISTVYSPSREDAILKRLGVRDMTDSDFLTGLENMDIASTIQSQSESWINEVSSRLLTLAQIGKYKCRMNALRLMPTSTGQWLSAAYAQMYVFDLAKIGGIPAHLELDRVATSVKPSSAHHQLLERFGVRPASPKTVATKILEQDQNKMSLEQRLENAVFLFRHISDNSIDCSRLRLVDEQCRPHPASEMYIDLPNDNGRLRRAVPSDSPFLHSRFMNPFGENDPTMDKWLDWLVRHAKLNAAPRIILGRASSDLMSIAERLPCDEFLELLAYFWNRLPFMGQWRDDLAKVSVTFSGVSLLLKETFLKRTRLTKYTFPSLSFLPVPDPDNSRWDFLDTLGVSTGLGAKFFVKLLMEMSRSNYTDVAMITIVYQQLAARFEEDSSFVSAAFKVNSLYFASGGPTRDQKWVSHNQIHWNCPSSLSACFTLGPSFDSSGLKVFFMQRLGVQNAPVDLLVTELTTFASTHSKRELSDEEWQRVSDILFGLDEAILAFKAAAFPGFNVKGLRQVVETQAVFPARIKDGAIELRSLCNIYIQDHSGRLAEAFKTSADFLALRRPSKVTPNSISHVLDLVSTMIRRDIGSFVEESSGVHGISSKCIDMTALLLERHAYIEQLYKRVHPWSNRLQTQTEFLEKLKNARTYEVDNVQRTLTLNGILVETSGDCHMDEHDHHVEFYFVKDSSHLSKVKALFTALSNPLGLSREEVRAALTIPLEYFDDNEWPNAGGMGHESPSRRNIPWLRELQQPMKDMPSQASRQITQENPYARTNGLPFGASVSPSSRGGTARHEASIPDTVQSVISSWNLSNFRGSFAGLGSRGASRPETTTLSRVIRSSAAGPPTITSGLFSSLDEAPSPSPMSRPTSLAQASIQHLEPCDGLAVDIFTLLTSEPNRKPATPYQQVNGVLGECYMYHFLSDLLGPDRALQSWTSELRELAGFSPYNGEALADFKVADVDGKITRHVLSPNDPRLEQWENRWPTYHFEVKATSRGAREPFTMSRQQLTAALTLSDIPDSVPPQDVYVLVRVWNVQNPSADSFAMLVDPIQAIKDGMLDIASQSLELMLGNF